jgi:undecaprenyl-diphosphatase
VSNSESNGDEASTSAWVSWAARLTRKEPERIAQFGGAIGLGVVFCVGLTYLFLKLADDVLEEETTAFDAAAALLARTWTSAQIDTVAWMFSLFGFEIVLVGCSIAVGILLFKRRWGSAGMLVLITLGAQLLNNLLKVSFHRTRPQPLTGWIPAQDYSFPSGHAMVSAALYGYLTVLAWRLLPGVWRYVAAAVLFALVLAIGWSRVYLEVHFPTDVIAGYLCGLLWLEACLLGSRILDLRRRPPVRERSR